MTHARPTRATALTALISAALTVLAVLTIPTEKASAQAPGSLISAEPVLAVPDRAAAYRVLYNSRGLKGETIPVSGVIIVPPGPVPPAGRKVIAWAHPTTGVISRCAPSLTFAFFRSVPGLSQMLAQGYVVAATDYPGLGTPEVHPYLVGISEGRAVLDSVRAARQIPGSGANEDYAVWGHSQGGQAALFAGLLAREYAPELKLAGIAAAAPATDLATLLKDDLGTGGGNNITAMTLWSWSKVYGAPLDSVVLPEAIPAVDALASSCIEHWYDILARRLPTQELKRSFLKPGDILDVEPWKTLLAQNSPGPLPPHIPVFIAQGTGDELVRPAVTSAYVGRLCRGGSKVRYAEVAGAGHLFVARDIAPDAVDWIAARFRGEAPPDDCGM